MTNRVMLRRRAGRKICQRGTDHVIHFTPMLNDEIVESMEWHELTQFRRLRNAMLKEGVDGISIEGQSVYFWIATILREILQLEPARRTSILHESTRFAPVVEALKAFPHTKGDPIVEHECYGVPKNCLPLLSAFQGPCDRLPSGHSVIRAVSGELRLDCARGKDDVDKYLIVFSDRFHAPPDSLREAMASNLAAAGPQVGNLLFLGLVCTGAEREATDVFGRSGRVPTKAELAACATRHGYRAHGLSLGKFDAAFLLPDANGVELFIVHCRRQPGEHLAKCGFKPLDGRAEASGPSLVLWKDHNQTHSYYGSLISQTVVETEEDVTDWSAWKRDRDWDPSAVGWQDGLYRGDIRLLEETWSKQSLVTTWENLRKYLLENANEKKFSPYLLGILVLKARSEKHEGFFFLSLFGFFEFYSNPASLNCYLRFLTHNFHIFERVKTKPPEVPPASSAEDLAVSLHAFKDYIKWAAPPRFGSEDALDHIVRELLALTSASIQAR